MERDEETGFSYHGSRYYAGWLGRWTSCDPIGTPGGINLYRYVNNRPISLVDKTGREGENPSPQKSTDENADTKQKLQKLVANTQKELEERKRERAPLEVEQWELTQQLDKLKPEEKEARDGIQKQIDANKGPLEVANNKIEELETILEDSKKVLNEYAEAEAKAKAEEDDPRAGLDVSLQYNPSDLGKSKTGNTVNLPSVEGQVVGIYRNVGKKWDKGLPFHLSELTVGKEPSVVLDFKGHKTDETGSNWSPPSAGFQITAVNLAWKLEQKGKDVDFIELGLPIQLPIVDTAGNLKWQGAAELDIHLDAILKTPKLTVFGTGNVGGTFNNPDPDGRRRFINAAGAGVGIKASF
jgi:RHS repeat-associated protein